ncbi:phytoene/squalene synthase family protein [Marinicauda sp. Alg238-R41]|uniref:phytoene/squalene synthase family protein n=1 Tax=Marinicauda sp. Alg238-R41 TaxID=2993447 RepID=UPI0022E5FB54|nr:squalene/phytoene synthase family protein [Marinicauda sp. Alg238-R41]
MTDFDALLATDDPDRRLAALFAPAEPRGRLYALYAFYHEIARIPDAVSEPMIGEMRLQWSRDAVEDLFADPPKVRRHDIYEALSELRMAPGGPDRETLITLIEARNADLGAGPFPTRTDRLDYVDRTAVALMQAAVRLLDPELDLSGEAGTAVQAAGRLWGLTGLIRALPALASAGRPPFAADELAGQGLTEIDLTRGRKPETVKAALSGLFAEARTQAMTLSQTRQALPAAVFPAVGYAGLARGYLRTAERAGDPYREPVDRPLFQRQWRLMWGSLTGRV